jgi:hypothetical protein
LLAALRVCCVRADAWAVVGVAMTYDEVCMTMATKSSAKTKEQWADWFSMTPEFQATEAQLIKDAIFEKDGPSVFVDIVAYLGIAASIVADVAGIGSGYTVLKALL